MDRDSVPLVLFNQDQKFHGLFDHFPKSSKEKHMTSDFQDRNPLEGNFLYQNLHIDGTFQPWSH